jgi:hypothetical protein
MANPRVSWTVKDRHLEPRGDEVLALGLVVTYPDRSCDIHIALQHPLAGGTPESAAVLDELRRLRDALNDILGGR